MLEIRRRVIHIFFGVFLIAAFSILGTAGYEYIEGVLLAAFLVGLWVIDQTLRKRKLLLIDYLLNMFERPHALPAYGAFWYGMGVLLLLSFINNIHYVQASIAILALGDGAATLIGIGGSRRIFYNKKKTIEGSLAFFLISSLAAYFFIGFAGVALSLICTIAESIDWGVDDNFVIPLTCALVYVMVGAA